MRGRIDAKASHIALAMGAQGIAQLCAGKACVALSLVRCTVPLHLLAQQWLSAVANSTRVLKETVAHDYKLMKLNQSCGRC